MTNTCTIIMYHYVRDLRRSRYPEIKGLDISLFEKQIDQLSRKFNFVTIEDMVDSIKTDTPLPDNSAYLTFDDGYIDHYTSAFPILKRRNIQGAFYIPTKTIEDRTVLDVNKIHFILASVKEKNKIVQNIFQLMDEYRSEFDLESNDEYYEKLAIANRFDPAEVIFIKRVLQHALPQELRSKIANQLFERYVTADEEAFSHELYMSEEQIKLMHEQGMHIGGHGANHWWFNRIDYESKKEEMKLSVDFLNRMTNNYSVKSISYPFGGYDDDTLGLADQYDYQIGFTTKVALAEVNQSNRLILPRFDTNDFL